MSIGILFDLDGTLLDTLQDLTDSVNATMDHYGCPHRTVAEVRDFIGNGARRLIQLSLPGKDDDPDVEEALAYYQSYYKAHSKIKTRPYEGIVGALQTLAEKHPVAIVSNKPDAATKALCREFFPGINARGEQPDCPRKPAPDMLLRAMQDIGVERGIYVGDSEVDVITAERAGCRCLSVLWGFRDRDVLEKAGGKHFCPAPDQLLACIEQLL